MKVDTAEPGKGTAPLFVIFEALLLGKGRASRLTLTNERAPNGQRVDGSGPAPDRVLAMAERLIQLGRRMLATGYGREPTEPRRPRLAAQLALQPVGIEAGDEDSE